MNNIIFVTYASGPYKKNIRWNKIFVKLFIRPRLNIFLTDVDLKKEQIYRNNHKIFDANVGAGYWAWKPWCILKAFQDAQEGDIVLYQDCGAGLRYKNFMRPTAVVNYAFEHQVFPGVSVPVHGTNQQWTHESCFINMDCATPEFFESPQIEAVISAWKVNATNKIILNEWLRYCLDLKVVSDKYVSSGSSFASKGHRYDQSILTNLVIKHGLKPLIHNELNFHYLKSLTFVNLYMSQKTKSGKIIFKIIYNSVNIINSIRMFIKRK